MISDFFIYENCHSSRASLDIDMKLGPVIKLDKRNMATSKNDDYIICAKFGVIFFTIHGHFAAMRKPYC